VLAAFPPATRSRVKYYLYPENKAAVMLLVASDIGHKCLCSRLHELRCSSMQVHLIPNRCNATTAFCTDITRQKCTDYKSLPSQSKPLRSESTGCGTPEACKQQLRGTESEQCKQRPWRGLGHRHI